MDKSYQDFVETGAKNGWPQCKWLQWFFKLHGAKKKTIIGVIDSISGQLSRRVFVDREGICEPNESLTSALNASEANVATRIIVVVHSDFNEIDKDSIAQICGRYNVDPLFVMSHFFWMARTQTVQGAASEPDVPQPIFLASEVKFLSMDYGSELSGILLEEAIPRTGETHA
jgi:hypothetical protein